MIVVLALVACGVLTREVLYLKHEIKEANHRAAMSQMQAAMIEAWVHAQINFGDDRLTERTTQTVNQVYPPKVEVEVAH